MLFQKFLRTIGDLLPDQAFVGNPEALAKLNPNKIYLENIRSFLNVSSGSAERICETAVRQGIFRKRIEVVRPDGAVAMLAESEKQIPEAVRFWREENGNYEEVTVPTKDLSRNVIYQLADDEASAGPHTQPA